MQHESPRLNSTLLEPGRHRFSYEQTNREVILSLSSLLAYWLRTIEFFFNKDGTWYYAGVYKAFVMDDLTVKEWANLPPEVCSVITVPPSDTDATDNSSHHQRYTFWAQKHITSEWIWNRTVIRGWGAESRLRGPPMCWVQSSYVQGPSGTCWSFCSE